MPVKRLNYLALLMAVAGYFLIAYNLLKPEHTANRTLCIIKQVSGFPCPACGTTRSATQIAIGNFNNAININPLGFIAITLMIIVPPVVIADLIQKKQRFTTLYQKAEQWMKKPVIAIMLILLILANWIWNITKGL